MSTEDPREAAAIQKFRRTERYWRRTDRAAAKPRKRPMKSRFYSVVRGQW